jgi:leucyl-tRNA synthetase
MLGHHNSLAYESWPKWDEDLCKDEELTIAVQINGKLKSTIMTSLTCSASEQEAIALKNPKIAELIQGITIRKIISVPGKIVNIVTG